MKGYKVFNPDWTCRGFKYEVGQTYEHKREITLCEQGFHFCKRPIDCFKFYDFNPENKVAEVEALGDVIDGDDKSVTNKIRIVREVAWHELLELVNTGKENTGYRNTGHGNSGHMNTGNWNSGDFNACNDSAGVFCTETPKLVIFDKPSNLTLQEWRNSEAYYILSQLQITERIVADRMTEEEKKNHPEHKTTGGYLKTYTYRQAWKNLWSRLTDKEKDVIKNIPNFNKDKFKKITGIKV